MVNRRVANAAVLAVFLILVIVAIVASPSKERGLHFVFPKDQSAAVVLRPPVSVVGPVAQPAAAPCVTSPVPDPYFLVCGATSVRTGDTVTFALAARGHVRDDCTSPTVDWGDGASNVKCIIGCDVYPADERQVNRELDHSYAAPGAYTVRFTLQSCGPDPHPQAEITMEVRVQ